MNFLAMNSAMSCLLDSTSRFADEESIDTVNERSRTNAIRSFFTVYMDFRFRNREVYLRFYRLRSHIQKARSFDLAIYIRGLIVYPLLPLWHDLKPVAVTIFDEVNSHGRIFETDAPHLFVQSMGGIVVVRAECQMKFFFTDVL